MTVLQSTAESAGLALGAGLVQLALAASFWGGRRSRPDWGLTWLTVSFACAGVVNLAGQFPSFASGQPVAALQVALVAAGVSALATLVIGVHRFLGHHNQHPALTFAVVMLWVFGGAFVLRRAGLASMAGHVATGVVFAYLAARVLRSMSDQGSASHALLLLSILLYPLLVLIALVAGIDRLRVSLWASVPFTVTGLGLLVAGLGRYHRELGAELVRREQAESELRTLNASLEQRIGERTQELETLVGELRSFNRMVSHDLRGPLGGMVGLTEIAQAAIDSGDSMRAKRMLAVMGKEVQRLFGLVGELLALARAAQGDLELQPVALEGVLAEALDALTINLGAQEVARITHEPLPQVQADPALLRQVLINLLANALKFSSVRPETPVQLRAHRQARAIVVEVRDQGVGFDAVRAADLFRPFARLHGTDYAGSGIGLTIVRRVIERHGGRVWAEGRPGEGASFFFSLPLPPDPAG